MKKNIGEEKVKIFAKAVEEMIYGVEVDPSDFEGIYTEDEVFEELRDALYLDFVVAKEMSWEEAEKNLEEEIKEKGIYGVINDQPDQYSGEVEIDGEKYSFWFDAENGKWCVW